MGRRLRNVLASGMKGGVFKLSGGVDLAPRVHGLREMDSLVDVETVLRAVRSEVHGEPVCDLVFPEVPSAPLRPELWHMGFAV